MSFKQYKDAKKPFNQYLEFLWVNDYSGSEAGISKSMEDWVSKMSNEELVEHANLFSRILLKELT